MEAVGALIGLYFLPTIVALARKRPNVLPIGLLNLFLGWTLVGWVVALVWATATTAAPAAPQMTPAPSARMSDADELAKLADLRDRGALTDDEFQERRRVLLQAPPPR